ncbi:hypothetical protein [Bacteroides sp. 224]|nr:hypothetical protein [Bacteroides sp. 224]
MADGIKFRGYKPDELLLKRNIKFEITNYKPENGIYSIRMQQIK